MVQRELVYVAAEGMKSFDKLRTSGLGAGNEDAVSGPNLSPQPFNHGLRNILIRHNVRPNPALGERFGRCGADSGNFGRCECSRI